MAEGRISQKSITIPNRIKTFIFDIVFIFTTNCITNQYLLLAIDLMEIVTLPFFYVNPTYTHLKNQEIFNTYFEQVHKYLYFNKQDVSVDSTPISLMVFFACFLALIIFRKSGPTIINMIAELILALFPIFILRVASEIINSIQYTFEFKMLAFAILPFTLIAAFMVLFQYQKLFKFCDLAIAIMLFLNINQYVIMGLLAVKITVTLIFAPNIYAKEVKLGVQISLLVSNFLLIFIKPILINQVMLAVLIVVSIAYPSFLLFLKLRYRDICQVDEEDQYCTQQKYSYNEIEYLKKMNKHIVDCVDLQCNCKQLIKVNGAKELRVWALLFKKDSLKRQSETLRFHPQKSFQAKIKYIKVCLQGEQPNFDGFVRLHQLNSKNIIQSYFKYHYCEQYRTYLQKSTLKILNMNAINESENSNSFEDLLVMENKICSLIQKVKKFWRELLLNSRQSSYIISLIEEISKDITKVKKSYLNIQCKYDEKQEAEYYYNIFRLLILHEKPSAALIDQHKTSYIMFTKGDTIVNITTNITHLLEKSRDKILGQKYCSLMLPAYANDHATWKKQFLMGYQPEGQNSFTKVISISPSQIKVVRMIHTLLPNFEVKDCGQSFNSEESGIDIVTLIQQKNQDVQQGEGQKMMFHLLVSKNTLDIIAYEPLIFEYFDTKQNVTVINKILRSNLLDMFPNLNKETITKTVERDHQLIAKSNRKFFIEFTQSQLVNGNAQLQKKQYELFVSQVPSTKNQQLNLLLLKFESEMKRGDKKFVNKKKSAPQIQLDLLKKKTLKNVIESTSQDKNKIKYSSNKLKYVKLILSLSFFLVFATNSGSLAWLKISYLKVDPWMSRYDMVSQFYLDLQYTKAYYLLFDVGEERIAQMQKFWNYNQKYPDVVTVFQQIQQKPFNIKFQQYVQKFQISPAYSSINETIVQEEELLAVQNKMSFIMFFSCIGLILVNLITSFYIFIRSQVEINHILESFLHFDSKQISNNLKKIEAFENFLQLHDFEQTFQIQVEDLNSETSCVSLSDRKSDLNSFQKLDSDILSRKKLKTSTKEEAKANFHLILNKYFENMINRKQNDLVSLSKITAKNNMKKTVILPTQKSRIRFNNSKKQSQLDDQERKNSLKLVDSLAKNYKEMIPSILGFILKMLTSVAILIYATNLLKQTIFIIQLKHMLFYQPSLIFTTVENQYFGASEASISQLSKQNLIINQQLPQIPSEFAQFKTFNSQLYAKNDILCGYINNQTDLALSIECYNKTNLFSSGFGSLISFIEEKLRQVATGKLNRSYLQHDIQFTISLKVCLTIFTHRNKLFSSDFKNYYLKHLQIQKILIICIVLTFLICLYLIIREVKSTGEKSNKAQNLFKIVPPFMKQQFEERIIHKQSIR